MYNIPVYLFTFLQVALEEVAEVDRFHPVAVPRASEDVVKFDEHALTSSFKVGIVYQKYGQVMPTRKYENHDIMMQIHRNFVI